jgi:hypothetical protein
LTLGDGDVGRPTKAALLGEGCETGRDSNRSEANSLSDLRTTFFFLSSETTAIRATDLLSFMVARCKARLPRVSIFHIIGAWAFWAAATALEVAGNPAKHAARIPPMVTPVNSKVDAIINVK